MGDDKALSTNELIEEICKSLGKKAHIWKLPKDLMNGVAKVGGWLHLPLNPERLRKLTENYVSSNAKIKRCWVWKTACKSERLLKNEEMRLIIRKICGLLTAND